MMDRERPLVSIITPSYNHGRFIEETIKSVLNQDYQDIEYIVVDGGSTDNTVEILKKYSGRIKWVSEKDNGQADAIDKGFRMSKGGILAWLNSDDTYLEGAVGKAVEALNSHPQAGMVYGRSFYIDEGGRVVGEYPVAGFDSERLPVFNFISQPSVFFKKDAYFGVGGVNRALSYTMDYDLWIRIARQYPVEYIPEPLSAYRLHGESKTVAERHALRNSHECLDTVIKYYGWAPANRVYVYSYLLLKSRLPGFLGSRLFMVPAASFAALIRYVALNRGVKMRDIKMLKLSNFRKMAKGWNGL